LEHLDVAMLSLPRHIEDRTAYLLGRSRRNPAAAIFRIVRQLERLGASVIGMPCNTAHAPAIFDAVRLRLRRTASRCRIVNMIEEVGRHIQEYHPGIRRIGLLATTGTCRCRVYEDVLTPLGLEVLQLPARRQESLVERAIYDKRFGIKAASPPSAEARRRVEKAMDALLAAGAEAVILGCTELPLAYGEPCYRGHPVIDTTLVLARALVREAAPRRLRPWRATGTVPRRRVPEGLSTGRDRQREAGTVPRKLREGQSPLRLLQTAQPLRPQIR
jgi:aspartate racemase